VYIEDIPNILLFDLSNYHEKPTEIFHSHIESCYRQQQAVPNMIDDNLVNTINKRDHEKI
jgi:hypothetical protein